MGRKRRGGEWVGNEAEGGGVAGGERLNLDGERRKRWGGGEGSEEP